MKKTACFILGMHRSGTSALGGVLNIMGLEFGTELTKPSAKENPKGFFENVLAQQLDKYILSEYNSDWDDLYFDVRGIDKSDFEDYVLRAEEILKKEFKYFKKFAIKDPRISLLFPIWEQACKNLGYEIKIILPYRNPLEVAKSLQKRNNFSIEKGLLLWAKYVLEAEKFSRDYEHISITFSELLEEPLKTMEALADFLSIEIEQSTIKKVYSFLDDSIKHNNIPLQNVSNELPIFFTNFINLIKQKDFNNFSKIDEIRDEFYALVDLFYNKDIKERVTLSKVLEERVKVLEEDSRLLDRIKDTTTFDEEFYKKEYPDLRRYKGPLIQHYIKHGNSEGRYPNEYSKVNDIDNIGKLPTPTLLVEKIKELEESNKYRVKLEEELKLAQEKIAQLTQEGIKQKETIEQLTQEGIKQKKTIEQKDKTIEQLTQDSIKQKESIEQKDMRIQDIIKQKTKLSDSYQVLTQKLHKEQENIKSIQKQRDKIEKSYKEENKKVKELTTSLDEVIEDFIYIKNQKKS